MNKLMLETNKCHCPYCGERIEVVVDTSIDAQEYIEDCWVCCRPITITAYMTDDNLHITMRSEDE